MADLTGKTDKELDDMLKAFAAEGEKRNTPVTAPEAKSMTKAEVDAQLKGPDSMAQIQSLLDAPSFAGDLAKNSMATINSGLNAATGGATGLAEQYGGAAMGKLGNAVSGEGPKSFEEFLALSRGNMQQRKADAPIASALGEIGGAVGAGMAAGPKIAAQVGGGAMSRILAGAGMGAAENMGIEAGKGAVTPESLMSDAGKGALFGGGGQALGEAASLVAPKIGRMLGGSQATTDDAAAISLQKQMAGTEAGLGDRLSKKGALTIADDVSNLKPNGQTLMDADPRYLTEGKRAIAMSDPKNLDGPRQLAADRLAQADEQAAELTNRYIRPFNSKGMSTQQMNDRLISTRAEYGDMTKSKAFTLVNHADASKSISRSKMDKMVDRTFGSELGAGEVATKSWLKKQLNAGRGEGNMSAAHLLKVKKTIDKEIGQLMSPKLGVEPSKVDMDSMIALAAVKKKITAQLGVTVPDYKRLAGNYASEFELQDARSLGADMFSKTAVDPTQFENFVKTMDGEPIKQQQFVQGALQSMMKKQGTDGIGEAKRLLKAGNNDYDKLAKIIPKDQLDEFVVEAQDLITRTAVGSKMGAVAEGVAGATPSGADANQLIRGLAGVGSAAQGRLGSAAYLSSGMFTDPIHDAVTKKITTLMASPKPEAAAELKSIMDVVAKSPKLSGAVAGMGLTSLMD